MSAAASPRSRWPDPGWLALVVYAGLVLYASLYPFEFQRKDHLPLWQFLGHLERPIPSDVAINFLAYVPLGFLMARLWRNRPWRGVALAIMICAATSFMVETAQRFVPYRYSELSDLLCDTAGAIAGAWLWLLVRRGSFLGGMLRRGINCLTGESPARLAALFAVTAWGAAQAIPVRQGIVLQDLRGWHATLRHALHSSHSFPPADGIGYALTAAAVILVARFGMRLPFARLILLLLVVCVVSGKIIVNGPALPPHWLEPTLIGALAALIVPEFDRPTIAAMVALSFLALELTPVAGEPRHVFNFVPFEGEITIRVNGLRVMLEQAWPFMAMAALIAFHRRLAAQPGLMWAGANAVGCYVFCLEWAQRFVPGRYGDITTVLIAVAAWLGTWITVAAMNERLAENSRSTLPIPALQNTVVIGNCY
jgi:VanZ family protein